MLYQHDEKRELHIIEVYIEVKKKILLALLIIYIFIYFCCCVCLCTLAVCVCSFINKFLFHVHHSFISCFLEDRRGVSLETKLISACRRKKNHSSATLCMSPSSVSTNKCEYVSLNSLGVVVFSLESLLVCLLRIWFLLE